jgi:hypothetical protein
MTARYLIKKKTNSRTVDQKRQILEQLIKKRQISNSCSKKTTLKQLIKKKTTLKNSSLHEHIVGFFLLKRGDSCKKFS